MSEGQVDLCRVQWLLIQVVMHTRHTTLQRLTGHIKRPAQGGCWALLNTRTHARTNTHHLSLDRELMFSYLANKSTQTDAFFKKRKKRKEKKAEIAIFQQESQRSSRTQRQVRDQRKLNRGPCRWCMRVSGSRFLPAAHFLFSFL